MLKNVDPEKMGKFIKLLRKSYNLTQEELGAKLFLTRKAVSKWETGRACPSIDTLKNLSDILGVSLEDITEGDFEKLEALLKKNDNVIYKTSNKEKRKFGYRDVITFIVVVIIIFVIVNLNAAKNYSINCDEDSKINLVNGLLSFSNEKNYISLGTIYSNYEGDRIIDDFEFTLYLSEDNDVDKELISSSKDAIISIPKSTAKIIKKALKKDKESLYMKIRYMESDSVIESYVKLKLEESRDFSEDDFDHMILSKELFGEYKDNLLFEKFLNEQMTSLKNVICVKTVDLSFLYNTSFEELKYLFDKKSLVINHEKYNIAFDNEYKIMVVLSNRKRLEFRFSIPSVKIDNQTLYYLNYNNVLPPRENNNENGDYELISEITNSLMKKKFATSGSVSK